MYNNVFDSFQSGKSTSVHRSKQVCFTVEVVQQTNRSSFGCYSQIFTFKVHSPLYIQIKLFLVCVQLWLQICDYFTQFFFFLDKWIFSLDLFLFFFLFWKKCVQNFLMIFKKLHNANPSNFRVKVHNIFNIPFFRVYFNDFSFVYL